MRVRSLVLAVAVAAQAGWCGAALGQQPDSAPTPRAAESVSPGVLLETMELLVSAQVADARQDFEQAESLTREALSAMFKAGMRGGRDAARVQILLAQRITNAGGSQEEARALARDAVRIVQGSAGETSPESQHALDVYSDILAGRRTFAVGGTMGPMWQILFAARPGPDEMSAVRLVASERQAETAERSGDRALALRAWQSLADQARALKLLSPQLDLYVSYRRARLAEEGSEPQTIFVDQLAAASKSSEATDGDALMLIAQLAAGEDQWELAADAARLAGSVYLRSKAPGTYLSAAETLEAAAGHRYGNTPRAISITRAQLERVSAKEGECSSEALPVLERLAGYTAVLGDDGVLLADRRILDCWRKRGAFASAMDPVEQRVHGAFTAAAARRLVDRTWSIVSRRPSARSFLLDEAFEAQQAARQTGASLALNLGAARKAAGSSGDRWDAAIDQAAAVERDIVAASADIADSAGLQRAQAAAGRTSVLQTLESIERDVTRADPRLSELLRGDPLTIERLQAVSGPDARLLGRDEALILIGPGDAQQPPGRRHGYVFVVTKEGKEWAAIDLEPAQLAAEIEAMRRSLDTDQLARGFGVRPVQAPFDRSRAYRLYIALFGDPRVAALLASKPTWLIAPQASLLSLPFAALVTKPPEGGARGDATASILRKTSWLGMEHTVSILPSVSTLALLRGAETGQADPSPIRFVGFGDPEFKGRSADGASNRTVRAGVSADSVRSLPRLEGTRAEITTLSERLNADARDVFLGARASEPSLRTARPRLARAQVIAFATHGLIAGDIAGLSEPALALTPPPAGAPASPEDDGLLTASEAAALKLSADWVILSACNTAAGDGSAEGLSGLARAFFYAGARSVLVSQWRIRDDVAVKLTTLTLAGAQTPSTSRAKALQTAMRTVLLDQTEDNSGRSLAHPAHWAPFIYVGVD